MIDFVTRYVNLLSRVTDAPEEFQEAAVLFLVATAAGRKWIFKSLPDATIFGNRVGPTGKLLNLWFILIGKNRITRKSSGVISYVEEISQRVVGEQRIISEAFTPESLIKEMSEKSVLSAIQSRETLCCWICDEISWFFHHLKKKGSCMVSADAFLSKIYDGSTYSRTTIGRGKETVWNPYLTCLLASTDYLPTLFDELQIRLGFMNRFIYVVAERKKRKPLRTEPLSEEEEKEVEQIVTFLKALAERTSVTMLEMTNEAKQVYDSFEEEIEKRIETEDLGIKEGYCGQLPNLVVRLSCLYRISRMTPMEIRNYNSPVLTVEKQDVERAIDYADKAWTWFEKVVEIMLRPRGKRSTKGSVTRKGRRIVIEIVKKGPAKREYIIEATRKAGIDDSSVDNVILPSLIEDNIIKRDKPGWYSFVTDHTNNTHSNRDEIE